MFFNYYRNTEPHFRFLVMGDSRGNLFGVNAPVFRTLLNKSRYFQPNFMLFLGDMVSGDSDTFKKLKNWADIVNSYYPINTCFPCMGNHDKYESVFNSIFYYLPNNGLSNYRKTVYYFDYLNARFIILNSCRKDAQNNYIIDSEQLEWLENTLKNNIREYCFVSLHIPPYPTSSHYGDSLDTNPKTRDKL